MTTLSPLPDTFVATRNGLHALAEHVLSPVRYLEEGRIGLRPTPGGFGTPMLGGDRQVRVSGNLLIDREGDEERRDDITTLADAAALVRVPIGAPDEVYSPTTDADPHRPLNVDRKASTVLGEWILFGATVLQQIRVAAAPEDTPSMTQLWPEHFDLAIDLGPDGRRVNVGFSPGDAGHPEPYLYVGPWGEWGGDPIWNEPFGASLSYADLRAGADPLAFISAARSALP